MERRLDTGHGVLLLEIFEDGVPARFRLRFQDRGGFRPVPGGADVALELERPDGAHERFALRQYDGFLESEQTVAEPHEFTVRVRLPHDDHSHDLTASFTEQADHPHDHGGHHRDNNYRAAFVHILADAGVTAVTTGGGADVIAVRTVNGATTVTSAGGSTITIGTLAPAAGGLLSGVQATLDITGGGDDTLIFDDTGASAAASGTLSPTALTGLGMAVTGVTYAGIGTLNVNLGDSGNALTVSDTAAATTTNVNGGAGVDTITVELDSGVTHVATAGGADVVNIRAINGVTTVDTGTGADVVNVGSSATLGSGVVDGITAALSVQGNTTATLNVLTLYTILQVRGWFHVTGKLAGRIGRQLIATAAMSAALWALMPLMASRYGGNVFERVWSLGVLVASGLVVFFAVALPFFPGLSFTVSPKCASRALARTSGVSLPCIMRSFCNTTTSSTVRPRRAPAPCARISSSSDA